MSTTKKPANIPRGWERNDEATHCVLLLASIDIPLTTIATWNDADCRAAERYVGSIHLRASDNRGVRRVTMPAALEQALTAQKGKE